jgi:hypothetical protein
MVCNYTHFASNPNADLMSFDASAAESITLGWATSILQEITTPTQSASALCDQATWGTYWSRVLNAIHYVQDAVTEQHAVGNQNCGVADVIPSFTPVGGQLAFGSVAACDNYLSSQLDAAAAGDLACDSEVDTSPISAAKLIFGACVLGIAPACMGLERLIRHHCYSDPSRTVVCGGPPANHCSGGVVPAPVAACDPSTWNTEVNPYYCEGEICPGNANGSGQDFLSDATAASIPVMEKMAKAWAETCKEPERALRF